MKQVIRKLGLADIAALHERAENLSGKKAYSHSFDVIVSRALSDLSTFFSMAIPLLKSDGVIIAFKGTPDEGEIEAAKRLTSKMTYDTETFRVPLELVRKTYTLPFLNIERSLLIFKAVE
jgi:16S rRNA (guanine527-N7)-methyltransferase